MDMEIYIYIVTIVGMIGIWLGLFVAHDIPSIYSYHFPCWTPSQRCTWLRCTSGSELRRWALGDPWRSQQIVLLL